MGPQGSKGVIGVWGADGVDLGVNLSLVSGMEQSRDNVTDVTLCRSLRLVDCKPSQA